MNFFQRMKYKNDASTRREPPAHIAVIMDGNGRWAKKRGLPRSAGHKAGAETFKRIVRYAASIGVRYFTVYAFSTENWKRPQDEVNTLIRLFIQYLDEALTDFLNENIRVRFMGEPAAFPPELQELIRRVERTSAAHTGMTLCVCLDYGGRRELVHAAQQLAVQVQQGVLRPEEITEQTISAHLYCPDVPDPDLIIRPSGEYRLSNFLLWQSAYAELVFMHTLWPDFTPAKLDEAIAEYHARSRRFGGV